MPISAIIFLPDLPSVALHPAGGEAGGEDEGAGGAAARGGEGGEDSEGEEGEEGGALSKKKRKLASRLKITELKQVGPGPGPALGAQLPAREQRGVGSRQGTGAAGAGTVWNMRGPAHRCRAPRPRCPQSCERPDVVEIWDVTAMDPKLLVHLKVRPLLTMPPLPSAGQPLWPAANVPHSFCCGMRCCQPCQRQRM